MKRSRSNRLPFLIWAGVPAVAFVGIVWFPFGFSMGGLLEEWDMLHILGKQGLQWNSFPGQPTSESFSARPLTLIPFLIAFLIDDRSFLGFHLVLMVACALKVLAGASIGYVLFRNRTFALALGLLFFVFPADTQQIALRNIHINLAIALMVCACALALKALVARYARDRGVLIATAIVLGILGSWIYEPVLTLYGLPPLMLFARFGLIKARRLIVRRPWIAGSWATGAAISAAYLYYLLKIYRSPYQTALAGGTDGGVFKSLAANIGYLIEAGATRTFVEAWYSAWRIAATLTIHWAYPVILACCVLALMLVFAFDTRKFHFGSSRFVRYIISGLIAAIAGYLPYLVSTSHIAITQRTFLTVALGAALVVLTLLGAASRLSRIHIAVVASVPITLGLVAQAYQHDRYTRASVEIIHPYLELVARQSNKMKQIHLVHDKSGVAGYLNGLYYSKVIYGPPVIRRAPNDIYVLCKDQPLTPWSIFSNCRLERNKWIVSSFNAPTKFFDSAETDVIHVDADFAKSRSGPFDAWRHRATFDSSDSFFLPVRGTANYYTCTADSMWGYSGFCAGEGWSDGAVVRDGLSTRSQFWAVSQDSSLTFEVEPSPVPYVLRILFASPPPGAIATSWSVALNGVVLERRWLTMHLVEATVPATLISVQLNKLQFASAVPIGDVAGLAIERITLAPAGSPHLISIAPPPLLRPGVKYVADDATAVRALVTGFSATEPGGKWTDGSAATVRFSVPPTKSGLILEASVVPFLNERHPLMTVDISIENILLFQQEFKAPSTLQTLRVPLPEKALGTGAPIEITLAIRNPASPEAVGAGHRWLGLFFKELQIVEEHSAAGMK